MMAILLNRHTLLPLWLVLLSLSLCLLPPASPADELNDLLTGQTEETGSTPDKVIETDSSAQSDRKIRKRLEEIFAELDALQNVQIKVNKDIVTLSGEVDTGALEDKALQLASQVEGVVEVKNELTINRSLKTRLSSTWEKLFRLSKQVIAGLPVFLLALAILALFWMLGRWLRNSRVYRKVTPNHFIANLLGQIVQLILIILGFILALILLDATALIGTILGAAGIVGLAVGFAVRDTVENYIASILLSLRNPFAVNDYVVIDSHGGNVLKLTSRATILISPDGNHIRIPNAKVYKAVMTNYTRHPERRFQFDIGVDTEQDLLFAQSLALETLLATDSVLATPKPIVVIEQLGDSNVLLRVYAWINQEQANFIKVRSEAIRAVKAAFDQAGIVMPEPIYTLRINQYQTAQNTAADSLLSHHTQSTDNTNNTAAAPEPVTRKTPPATPENSPEMPPDTSVPAQREVQDLRPDDTLQKLVEAERAQDKDDQDLLSDDAPKE